MEREARRTSRQEPRARKPKSKSQSRTKAPPAKAQADSLFRATYRLQLRDSFRFHEAAGLTGYLADLGISHLYLSPILEARPGSNHGYDAIDPTRVSEERGGEEGFARLAEKVEKTTGLEGVILDIVPNHVAATTLNPAWRDVLRNGPRSRYWDVFDFRASREGDRRIVLPVLGRSRQACVAARELQFDLHPEQGIVIRYWENLFPVAARSYHRVLASIASEMNEQSARARRWVARLEALAKPARDEAEGERRARAFVAWLGKDPVALRVLQLSLRTLPLKTLEETLEEQHYRLEEWRAGSRDVNYRRFFDINDLAALRMEDAKTFNWAHSKIRELSRKYPIVHGLRVDHVDGLTDPEGYLRKLRTISRNVWVEKILGEGEHVPPQWPVTGTTGYEFSGLSARLFVDVSGLLQLHGHYTRHVDRRWLRFHDCVYDSKREMIDSHFVSEFEYLTDQFHALATRGSRKPAFTRQELHEALKELTSSLRVYRTYFVSGQGATDLNWLRQAFAEVEGRGRLHSKAGLEWLRTILLGRGDWSEETYRLLKRWEQLTGPVMAKGLEDTALYRYFPLLSLNVVGGEPDWAGDGATEFHAFNQDRLRSTPLSMSTTSTHDTKRSEDVRSRIHVISEISEDWVRQFETWHKLNRRLQANPSRPVPDLPTEYLIYETLVGSWPHDGIIDDAFIARMKQYFLKAAREAKSETSWIEPNPAYENALMDFVDKLLNTKSGAQDRAAKQFQDSFRSFAEACSYFGAFNSLGLLTLKALSPGLPDFYQGCELWDLSLVDPDNRRPVDWSLRRNRLKELKRDLRENPKPTLRGLLKDWKSGDVKLCLTWKLLSLRRQDPELFTKGDYLALELQGEAKRNFVCFMRRYQGRSVLVLIPRLLASREMKPGRSLEIADAELLATDLKLPDSAPTTWRHLLTSSEIEVDPKAMTLTAEEILDGMPVGVIVS